MAANIRFVDYFNTTVDDRPGEAYKTLRDLENHGVNLLAFSAIPVGPNHTQLVLFPEDVDLMVRAAEDAGMILHGPHHAFLVQGDDELGAFAAIHRTLYDASINVYTSMGVTDGQGRFGYLIYVREGECQRAANALGIEDTGGRCAT